MLQYKSYLFLLAKSPRAFIAACRLLAARYRSEGFDLIGLFQGLDEYIASVPGSAGCHDFPRVGSFEFDGRLFYVRLYQTTALVKASRYLSGARWGAEHGISVPLTLHTSFRRVAGRQCYVILEESVNGCAIGHTPWDSERARRFANQMSRWHSISKATYAPLEPLLLVFDRAEYRRRLGRRAKAGSSASRVQLECIDRARSLLNSNGFMAPMCFSQGDVNLYNTIEAESGALSSVDLDMICCRPPWHDLSLAMCKFMARSEPEVVDAFERTYFQGRKTLLEQWLQVRRDWMFFVSVLDGVRWLAMDRSQRLGSGVSEVGDRETLKWAQHSFARAQALAETPDNASAGVLIARMRDKLQRQEPGRGSLPKLAPPQKKLSPSLFPVRPSPGPA